jgi:hypothetical protein
MFDIILVVLHSKFSNDIELLCKLIRVSAKFRTQFQRPVYWRRLWNSLSNKAPSNDRQIIECCIGLYHFMNRTDLEAHQSESLMWEIHFADILELLDKNALFFEERWLRNTDEYSRQRYARHCQELAPKSCFLQYCQGKYLPETFGTRKQHSNLTNMQLDNNMLLELPHSIGNLVNLRRLNASSNMLTHLPESVKYLVNLEEIRLFKNRFDCFPAVLCNLPNLRVLDFSQNEIRRLPLEIQYLGSLQTLLMKRNALEYIPEFICTLNNLKILEMDENIPVANKQVFAFLLQKSGLYGGYD